MWVAVGQNLLLSFTVTRTGPILLASIRFGTWFKKFKALFNISAIFEYKKSINIVAVFLFF
jgi:hypothetical protein